MQDGGILSRMLQSINYKNEVNREKSERWVKDVSPLNVN